MHCTVKYYIRRQSVALNQSIFIEIGSGMRKTMHCLYWSSSACLFCNLLILFVICDCWFNKHAVASQRNVDILLSVDESEGMIAKSHTSYQFQCEVGFL